jgi:hypothetical protein
MVMYHRKASKDIVNQVMGYTPVRAKNNKVKSVCCDKIGKKGRYCKSCPLTN